MADLLVTLDPTLVQVSADWCAPCKQMRPHAERIARELNIKFIHADIARYPNVSPKYDIKSVPTFLIFVDGSLKGRITGAMAAAAFHDRVKELVQP